MAQYSTPIQTNDQHKCWIQRLEKEALTAQRF